MNSVSRVVTVVSTAFAMVLAGVSASVADSPTTWEEGPKTDTLYYLTLLLAFPAGLFVLISLFGLLTARRNYVPPAPSTEVEKAGDRSPAHH